MKITLETSLHYPDFHFLPSDLSKFIRAGNLFTIMLQDTSIIHFEPQDVSSFLNWLQFFNIKDLREYYF